MNYCNHCNRCKKTCDCGPQKPSNNPCGGGCGGCGVAKYGCKFDIQVSPYDPTTWILDFCGCLHKIKVPKLQETCTSLYTNYSNATLIYEGECSKSILTGRQIGELINIDDLRDVEAPAAESCDILVFDPGCIGGNCGDGCKPIDAKWRNYHIPDAGDCIIELDEEGYYHVLVKDDCGCIKECRLPAKPEDEDKIIYLRDSTPEDPDYPWYYGIYNETINLYLAQNVPKWFGKYDLEITINYDVQVILSNKCLNTNYRSLVVPCVEGQRGDAAYDSAIVQGQSTWIDGEVRGIPWGTVTQRSSITFVVPKGKEAYLHHEFRLRSAGSFPTYVENALDGQRIPDSVVQEPNQILWTGSRLHALQCIIKPTSGEVDKSPAKDAIRDQLDHWEDWYPNPIVPGA